MTSSRTGENPVAAATQQRTVVMHYHLFKNAGTSLDAVFQEQFGGGWVTKEFPEQPAANRQHVRDWIAETPEAVCFSSHTALLPPPEVPGAVVLPVIFVRHPLDRIVSAYTFEHTQNDPGFGSTLARNTSLRGYVETRLAMPRDRQCRDFQVARFAAMFPGKGDDELERALRALQELPYVGVVESFEGSLSRLQTLLREAGFTGLDLALVRRNVSHERSASLDERLDRMAEELGPEFYRHLVRANENDLAFYKAAVDAASRWVERGRRWRRPPVPALFGLGSRPAPRSPCAPLAAEAFGCDRSWLRLTLA